MDASRPLLGHEKASDKCGCLSRLKKDPEALLWSSGAQPRSSTDSSSHASSYSSCADAAETESWSCGCSHWSCWKWLFPERITDYEDFATSAQMGEIFFLRQKARENFDSTMAGDEEMLQDLWNSLFPTLPYEGRVNSRWRDVGFQNDDPVSDLRTSGRLALKMLLYFADHMNDEFKRMVRENRFPVCLCAINLLEILLIHLSLKDPLPLLCPCCGTENVELDASQPSRSRPELRGFTSLLADAASQSSSQQLVFTDWPVEVALGQLFMHSMLALDAVWQQKTIKDPSTTLLHFRDALFDTRRRVVALLSWKNSPLSLKELSAWSYRLQSKKRVVRKNV